MFCSVFNYYTVSRARLLDGYIKKKQQNQKSIVPIYSDMTNNNNAKKVDTNSETVNNTYENLKSKPINKN